MDKYQAILKTIVKSLETLLPKYEESISDEESKTSILDASMVLAKLYHRIKESANILDKLQYMGEASEILDKITNLLNIAKVKEHLNTISDLHYNQINKEINVVVKHINNFLAYIDDNEIINIVTKIHFVDVVKRDLMSIYPWYATTINTATSSQSKLDEDIGMIEVIKTKS